MLKIQMLEQIVTRDSVAEEQQEEQHHDGYVPIYMLKFLLLVLILFSFCLPKPLARRLVCVNTFNIVNCKIGSNLMNK